MSLKIAICMILFSFVGSCWSYSFQLLPEEGLSLVFSFHPFHFLVQGLAFQAIDFYRLVFGVFLSNLRLVVSKRQLRFWEDF
jgi:hypothetical protein